MSGVTPAQVQSSITTQAGFAGVDGNINANPLFVNPSGGNFELQSGSPALHAGTSAGAPAIDIDCQPRGSPPSIGAYEFEGPDICPSSPGEFPTDTHDFNGDGYSDIAWRDTSGDTAIWLMNGTSILNPTTSYVATVSPSTWSIVGQRDFNGDGKSDILWRDTSGDVAIWEMNGTTILNPTATYVATVSTASGWTIVGTGDFNGDGYGDILWRDTSGDVAIWLMNGTTILNPTTSYVATVPTASGWTIVGTGDFNGDGKTDILWHDTSGDVAIWEMNGTTILNPTTSYVATVSPSTWTIVE